MANYPALDVRFPQGPGVLTLQDLLYAELDAFEPLAIHDAGDGWRVFFRLPSQRDAARVALGASLGARLLSLSPADVDDGDWARRSQAALTAIRVGRVIVAPPWDLPPPGHAPGGSPPGASSPDIVIVIEPSMGFGTGHHATTRLCLELLQTMALDGRRAIDVGTGSGVLALAALRLGAASVTAVDNDPDALQNARENIARNAASASIAVIEADLGTLTLHRADVVLANLTGAVLQRWATSLRGLIAPGGALIVSGFSPEECGNVTVALGLSVADVRVDGEWAAALLRPRIHSLVADDRPAPFASETAPQPGNTLLRLGAGERGAPPLGPACPDIGLRGSFRDPGRPAPHRFRSERTGSALKHVGTTRDWAGTLTGP